MMIETDTVIAGLVDGLRPVRRLPAPALRAASWLGATAALSLVLVAGFADMTVFAHRASQPMMMAELIFTLMTGVLAVLAAFELSLPDRSFAWIFLPLPSLVLWVGSSSYSCWRQWLALGPEGYAVGESAECFAWIVGFGVPLAVSLFILLRRSRPLSPAPVAAMSGLGVASIAAFLLQFFHPFDVTFIDLGFHLAAVGAVVLLARAAAERGLSGRRDSDRRSAA
jgi:hypothetical protein